MRPYARESVECLERGTPYGLYGCNRTGRSHFQGYIGQALVQPFISLRASFIKTPCHRASVAKTALFSRLNTKYFRRLLSKSVKPFAYVSPAALLRNGRTMTAERFTHLHYLKCRVNTGQSHIR